MSLLNSAIGQPVSGYNSFDERLETLVVETRTLWGAEFQSLPAAEKKTIAVILHTSPQLASHVAYERTHTGFIREITVSEADFSRLKLANTGGED